MNGTGVAAQTRELAERLVRIEAASKHVAEEDADATCRVCEKLRRPLVTLTGSAGFSSLLSRALILAQREAPALGTVQVKADGSMQGFQGAAAAATHVLVTYLLSLLITFIGETLTMRLIDDIWPELPQRAVSPLEKEAK